MQKEQSSRRIAFGLNHNTSVKEKNQSEELKRLPACSKVFVYKQKSGKWEGPQTFIEVQGETVTVQMPTGRQIYRTNVVKPVISSNWQDDEDGLSAMLTSKVTAALFGTENMEVMGKDKSHLFIDSRKAESDGLWKNGTFKTVKRKRYRLIQGFMAAALCMP